MRKGALLLFALAPAVLAPALARKPGGQDACAPRAQLYIAAMGEPFRAPAGAPDPMAGWFAQADGDHDGRVTRGEFLADADRFFARLDRNHDGEIDPPEVTAYERDIAPEIRLYQRGALFGGSEKRKGVQADYEGTLGAGRFAQLNIPEPVASADEDFNRGITREEFRATATRRFDMLDTAHGGVLTLAGLARTPAQRLAADCAARAAKAQRKR